MRLVYLFHPKIWPQIVAGPRYTLSRLIGPVIGTNASSRADTAFSNDRCRVSTAINPCSIIRALPMDRCSALRSLPAATSSSASFPSSVAIRRRRNSGSLRLCASAAVEDRRAWFLPTACCQAQQSARILRQNLETSRGQPALRLFVSRRPGQKIIRHGTLGDAIASRSAGR